jgi:hypothetical protein
MENIAYNTDAISAYFSTNRRTWEQFYPSERWLIERIAAERAGRLGNILDVGCACGGLGAALGSRYDVTRYVGIDINEQAIALARGMDDIVVPHELLAGDIMCDTTLKGAQFDTVFNLSCADWNVNFGGILDASWARVAPGGVMLITLRLTEGQGVRDMGRSYQFIHYGGADTMPTDVEKAAYVVLNVSEALAELSRLGPDKITGYGYWGAPSATARTPFTRLAFSIFALHKPGGPASASVEYTLNLPAGVWASGS